MEKHPDFTNHNKTLLSIRNLNKKFQNKTILSNVSLDIFERTINAIIGQNGSGKTTLLRTILGLYSITSGSITRTIMKPMLKTNIRDNITDFQYIISILILRHFQENN